MVTKSQCPECASHGKDNHRDNLVTFDNGNTLCFSCGYVNYNNLNYKPLVQKPTNEKSISLPEDVTNCLPNRALEFLHQFHCTLHQIKENFILWSEQYERICFPIYTPTELLAWQGRYLGKDPKKPKWFSQGKLNEILHITKPYTSKLILTEDIISAIRVGSQEEYCASPLFGSHVSVKKLAQYLLIYRVYKFYLWLDKDKEIESYKYAQRARQLGIDCVTIVTDKDPKAYTDEEITTILKDYD